MKHRSEDRLLNLAELANFLGVARSTIYRWMHAGRLPKPYELGERAVRWRMSESEQWLEEKRR